MQMRNLAIIPARSGSKGLRDKNIRELCGKPLMAYTINEAIKSGVFSNIMVSTDSEKYAGIAIEYGAEVPFLRSEKTSSDQAGSWDVVKEVLNNYMERGMDYDSVCLLQPTSPLRTSEDIVAAYKEFSEKEAESIIGVCESDHSPLWMNTLPEDLCMENFVRKDLRGANRQQLDVYYRINGAMYIRTVSSILENKSVYDYSFAYIMPRERSVDIDTMLDFVLAEALLKINREG